MLQARVQSKDGRPAILAYIRDDPHGFQARLQGSTEKLDEMIRQKRLAESFVQEHFHDADSNTNLRAYHSFQEPSTFAKRLRVHLKNKLDELALDSEPSGRYWDIVEQGSPYRGLEVFDVTVAKKPRKNPKITGYLSTGGDRREET